MAVRVTAADVQKLIETDSTIWDDIFITNASILVDRALTVATANVSSDNLPSTSELELMEMYLAAHLYALRDPQTSKEKSGKASATFQGQFKMGLEATYWGQMALAADPSGSLAIVTASGSGDGGGGGTVGAEYVGE